MRFLVSCLILLVGLLANPASVTSLTANPLQKITVENASALTQLAILGKGETGDILWSNDGKHMIVSTTAGIWIYDTADFNAPPNLIQTRTGYVSRITLNDDAHLLASNSYYPDVGGGYTQFWDLTTGQPVENPYEGAFSDHQYYPRFSPDGKRMLIDNKLIDLATSKEITVEPYAEAPAFSPDSELLALPVISGTPPNEKLDVVLVEAATGKKLATLNGHFLNTLTLQFSADGSKLFATTYSSNEAFTTYNVYLWYWNVADFDATSPIESTPPIQLITDLPEILRGLIFNLDTDNLFVLSGDTFGEINTIRVFDTATSQQQREINTKGMRLVFRQSDKTLFSVATENNELTFYDYETLEPVIRLPGFRTRRERNEPFNDTLPNWHFSVPIQPDTIERITPYIRKQQTFTTRFKFVEGEWFRAFTISNDGRYSALKQAKDEPILLRNEVSGELVDSIKQPSESKLGLRFSDDNQLLLIDDCYQGMGSNENASIWIWSIAEKNFTQHLEANNFCAPALSPDNRWLATATYGDGVQIWDVGNGKLHQTLDAPTTWQRILDYNTDGTLLAGGAYFGELTLWDTAAGKRLVTQIEHTWGIIRLTFLDDDHLIMTESSDGTIRLWGVPSSNP